MPKWVKTMPEMMQKESVFFAFGRGAFSRWKRRH